MVQNIKKSTSFTPILMAVIVLTLISVISCGKVTQEVAMKDIVDSDVFTLTYSLEVFPTESIKTFVKMDSQFPSQNVFTVADDTVFVWVGGINEGQWDTLSWGRAVLSKKDSSTTGLLGTTLVRATQNVTANVSTLIQYDASVFNRSGIRVKGSEYSESFLTFKQGEKSYSWYGTSVKIKRGYGLYMVALYSNKNKFYMKAFSESVASSNMTVALNKLMKHDTFMTSLLLMDMAREGILETPRNFEDAESLFSSGFTSALPYKFPKNTIKEFNIGNPQFVFDSALEDQLLSVYYQVDSEIDDAIKQTKAISKKLISTKSRQLL